MNKTSAWVAGTLGGLVVGFVGASAAGALTPGEETSALQARLVTRGAIVMLGAHPAIHTNAAHTSLGHPRLAFLPGHGRSKCYLEVHLDQNSGEKILNISATPDDKMVQQGITVGTAGGNGRVSVRLYRGWTSSGRPKSICATDSGIDRAANIWLQTTVLNETPVVEAVQE